MSSAILFAKAYFKNKSSVFWITVFPIFLLLIFGNIYGGGGEEQKIPVYLSAEGDWKNALAVLNGTFEIRLVQGVENPVQFVLNKTLETRRPATLVVAKADSIDVYSTSAIWGKIVSEAVRGVVYNVTYSRFMSRIPIMPIPVVLPSTPNVTLTVIGANATRASLGPVRITTTLMLVQAFSSGITGVAGLIAALVAAGLHKRIVLFGVSRLKTALNVVAATLIFSLASTLMLLAVAQTMFKAGHLLLNPYVWIAYLLNFFMFAGVGLLLSNAVTQGRAAPQTIITTSVMIFLTFAFISNYFIPLEVMPRGMAQIALALPTSYTASYAYVAALGGTPTPDVLMYPTAATAALFTLGLLLFKPYRKP